MSQPYTCLFCSTVCIGSAVLTKHYLTAHPLHKRACPYCVHFFRKKNALITHISSVHKDRCCLCDMSGCGKYFESKKEYAAHNSTHPVCALCSVRLKNAKKLTKHINTKHAMSVCRCGERYKKGMQQEHWNTSLKHPTCSICEKGCEDTVALTRHKLAHHIDVHCSLCGNWFNTPDDLRSHRLDQHMKPSCMCTTCTRNSWKGDNSEPLAQKEPHGRSNPPISSLVHVLPPPSETSGPMGSIAARSDGGSIVKGNQDTATQQDISTRTESQPTAKEAGLHSGSDVSPSISSVSSSSVSNPDSKAALQSTSTITPENTSTSSTSDTPTPAYACLTISQDSEDDSDIVFPSRPPTLATVTRSISPSLSLVSLPPLAGSRRPLLSSLPSSNAESDTKFLSIGVTRTQGLGGNTTAPSVSISRTTTPVPGDFTTSRPNGREVDSESNNRSGILIENAELQHYQEPTEKNTASAIPLPTSLSIPIYSCRICLKQPTDPVATMCGHIFCHRCIIDEISKNLQCPVCQRMILLKLNIGPA